jgi:hypothetical protein
MVQTTRRLSAFKHLTLSTLLISLPKVKAADVGANYSAQSPI